MDSLARLIRYAAAFIALTVCAFPTWATYTGPDQAPAFGYVADAAVQPVAAACAAVPATLEQAALCIVTVCNTPDASTAHFSLTHNGVAVSLPVQQLGAVNLYSVCSVGGEVIPRGGFYGIQAPACTDSTLTPVMVAGEVRCRSACNDLADQTAQVSIPISDPAQTVANTCLTNGGRSCEMTVADATNFTLDGQLYRVGTYTYTGSSCTEATTPPTTSAILGEVGSGGGSGGGLDAADKANLEAVKTNTGAGGALASRLDELIAQGEPTTSGTASFMNCTSTFTCTGNPVQCLALQTSRALFCDREPVDPSQQQQAKDWFQANIIKTPEALRGELKKGTTNLATHIDRPRIIADTGCPAPEEISLNFGFTTKTLTVGFQPLCDLANMISFFLLFTSSVVGMRIFLGGFS